MPDETTEPEETTEVTTETETTEVADEITEDEDDDTKTFPASVVRKLRKEAADNRVAAKDAEARAEAAEARAVAAEEKLARKPVGDIGQGVTGAPSTDVDLLGMLRART
ncbi:hypothetical protein CIW52_12605 [Mycolicibacterium sp. P9-64]|uniref:hypothetical protein n=1 Tax=Mycolicibacterium sp. P9-64 TaxID=2024612 RepID=UPI0011EE5F8D|nr:hypothetical protein [Mycolicibacterium sp. P9-64]KAA0083270.1 hypothetical protein CIW52_12605 [Mycolicibacterium sp. P9-64]